MNNHRWKRESNRIAALALLLGSLLSANSLFAQTNTPGPVDTGRSPEELAREQAEDQAREKAIAEFTQKMKDANYPALFEKAAREFNVPVDILEGISFAETRWEHLQW